jgi:hypothetical protein
LLKVGASTSPPTPQIFGAHPVIKVPPTLPIDILACITSQPVPKSDRFSPNPFRLGKTINASYQIITFGRNNLILVLWALINQ